MNNQTNEQVKTSEGQAERQNVTITLTPEMQDKLTAVESGARGMNPLIRNLRKMIDDVKAQNPEAGERLEDAWNHAMGEADKRDMDYQKSVEVLVDAAYEGMNRHKEMEGKGLDALLGDLLGRKQSGVQVGVGGGVSSLLRAVTELDAMAEMVKRRGL